MDISVIIPVYNCSAYLETIVDSIDRSGLDVSEIIMVNDGSTDDTGAVLDRLAALHPSVKVVAKENGGVSSARNRGLSEAKGDYVYFIDADDSLEPGSLAGVNGLLESERPDMLLFGMRFDYYFMGRPYRSDAQGTEKRGPMDAETMGREFVSLFNANMLSPVWNKLIRRELIETNGIRFREDMIEMEDYLFSVSCLAACSRIYLMDVPAYRYRQAEDERGTFNRLWRIGSLSRYVEPFYDAAELFDPRCGARENALKTADCIYSMLFREKLRFADVKQIRLASEDMLSGPHSEVIAKSSPALYGKLRGKRYLSVWTTLALRRAKHRASILVKYARSLGRKI